MAPDLQPIPAWMYTERRSLPDALNFWEKTQVRVVDGVVLVKAPGVIERPLGEILAQLFAALDLQRERIMFLEIRTGLCDPPRPPERVA